MFVCSSLSSSCSFDNFLSHPLDPALKDCLFVLAIHYLGFAVFLFLSVFLAIIFLVSCFAYNACLSIKHVLENNIEGGNEWEFFRFPLENEEGPQVEANDMFDNDQLQIGINENRDDSRSEGETELWIALAIFIGTISINAVKLLIDSKKVVIVLVVSCIVLFIPCTQLAKGVYTQFTEWQSMNIHIHVRNYHHCRNHWGKKMNPVIV